MDKPKFWCTSCKFKFEMSKQPNLCPYCGKGAVEKDVSKGAEDLLREVSSIGED